MEQNLKNERKKYEILSGTALKGIAAALMLVGNAGSIFVYGYLKACLTEGTDVYQTWNRLYLILWLIGQSAFPIFACLISEGFLHTGSRRRCLIRLIVFALIAEIPFQLSFPNTALHNVMFTLAIGFAVLWGIEELSETAYFREQKSVGINLLLSLLQLLIYVAGAAVAVILRVEYGIYGVLAVTVCYLLREYRLLAVLAVYLVLAQVGTVFCLPGCLLFLLYDGKRSHGRGNKETEKITGGKQRYLFQTYFFYLFYPLHLILLYLVRQLIVG